MSYVCKKCECAVSDVLSTREAGRTVRRRRECRRCKHRWTTYEVEAELQEAVKELRQAAVAMRKLTDRVENVLAHFETQNEQRGNHNGENLRRV